MGQIINRRRVLGGGGYITDLSMVDNAGKRRQYMTTANCYLVHKAGQYMLPLVYGNAIRLGTVNTNAFNPGGTTTTNYCANFVNHNGTAISAPWITKSASGTGVDKGMGLTVSSAELLWQDVQGLITDVSVDGDYLYFTVGSFTEGNAVIAIKDSNNDFMWNWHIWATNDTIETTTSIETGSRTYRVAPVNLGWVATGGNGKQGYCPYYQFGRKDPFIPAAGYNSTTNHTVYDINGNSITAFSFSQLSLGIHAVIRRPTIFIYNSSTKWAFSTPYYNLWDANNKTTGDVTSHTTKTIYDPCPPGFSLPSSHLDYYLGNTAGSSSSYSTYDATNKGRTWIYGGADLWLPLSGRRAAGSGALQNVGTSMYTWCSDPADNTRGHFLFANSTEFQVGLNNAAMGAPVRPVLEVHEQ